MPRISHSPVFAEARRAAGVTLYLILVILLLNGGKATKFVAWDGVWFARIVQEGFWYIPNTQSTIAFFPAFPLWAKAVRALTGLSSYYSPVVAAQLASVGFFTMYFLLCRRLGLSRTYRGAALAYLLVQPGAFYLALPYSESITCWALTGFVYWSLRAQDEDWRDRPALPTALVLLHGIVLTSSRVVGVVLACFPLLLSLCRDPSWRRGRLRPQLKPLLLSLAPLAGFLAFLAYGEIAFGRWNIYWVSNYEGWHLSSEAGKLLTLHYWRDVFPMGNLPEMSGRALTFITLYLGARLLVSRWRRRAQSPELLALALFSGGFFFETVIGSHGMHSMIRYLIPIYALLIPTWMRDRQDRESPPQTADFFICGVLVALECLFIVRYSTDMWVS